MEERKKVQLVNFTFVLQDCVAKSTTVIQDCTTVSLNYVLQDCVAKSTTAIQDWTTVC